jgi:coenzyme F420-reducing hydrogenase delta subunit
MKEKIIIFFCEWSSYPGMQLSKAPLKYSSGPKSMVTLCGARLSPELILHCFEAGTEGVLVACCPPEECDHNGNYLTLRRMLLLKKMLPQFGIDSNRLKLVWISKGGTKQLKNETEAFESEIMEMGAR